MKIATLQFAPKLGDVWGNFNRANKLLERGKVVPGGAAGETRLEALRPDLLVLPELAFTG